MVLPRRICTLIRSRAADLPLTYLLAAAPLFAIAITYFSTTDSSPSSPSPSALPEPGEESADRSTPPIVESSTIEASAVLIRAHPVQKLIDVRTDTREVQVIVDRLTLNGVEFHNPDQPVVLEDVTVTHNPAENTAAITTY